MSATLTHQHGCSSCLEGPGRCDHHQVPPVCVCVQPTPGWMNECGTCRRPYGPQFDEVRQAWRDVLGLGLRKAS